MLHGLPAPIHGTIMALLLILNTVLWAIPVYAFIVVKLLTPAGAARDRVSRLVAWLAQNWAGVNSWMAQVFMRIEWDLRVNAHLDPKKQLECGWPERLANTAIHLLTFRRQHYNLRLQPPSPPLRWRAHRISRCRPPQADHQQIPH